MLANSAIWDQPSGFGKLDRRILLIRGLTAPGLVITTIFFGDVASAVGVIRRFLEEGRAGPLADIGDTSSSSAAATRCGVDGFDIVRVTESMHD
jgi:hypothetical protein